MPKVIDTETFIQKAISVHKDRYDYSKVVYKSAHEKICIICKKHGEFWQRPNAHLNGRNCPECGRESVGNKKRFTTEEFIKRAEAVHKGKYDYSKVEYKTQPEKVCIICKTHGEFWQLPNNHLRGEGCQKCKIDVYDTETFINKASKLHNNFYDYNKVNYIKTDQKVIIGCPIHGDFLQKPNLHLSGRGCPKCGDMRCAESKRKDTQYFIEKANIVHNYVYDYSKVNYYSTTDKVCIICKKHGEFWQEPGNHLMGSGCPKCLTPHIERTIEILLEKHNIKFEVQKKFKWLVNEKTKRPLVLDFYLPDYNIAIECQGGQHFKAVGRFGGETAFNNNLYRDLLKIKLCKEHNIKLLHFINTASRAPKDWDYYELIKD